ncbi:response regulator [bacterium]|nr:response regulator [bacterium]
MKRVDGPEKRAPRILVVEDNPMNMELVRDLLQAYGCQVSEAVDAEDGWQSLKTEIPDLILLDLQLPKVGGFVLARAVRRTRRLRGVPVVAMTAYVMAKDQEKAKHAGCIGVIIKPIDTRTFPREVEGYLRQGRQAGFPSQSV